MASLIVKIIKHSLIWSHFYIIILDPQHKLYWAITYELDGIWISNNIWILGLDNQEWIGLGIVTKKDWTIHQALAHIDNQELMVYCTDS